MDSTKTIQLCLILAFAGCGVTFAGDILLLGGPLSGKEYFTVYKKSMINVSHWRLLAGNTLGLFVILELFGFWALYLVLKKDHSALAKTIFFCLSFSMLAGLAYHSAFAFYGVGLQVHDKIKSEITALMIQQFEIYHAILYKMLGLFFGLGSAAFAILVLWKNTIFKKWHAFLNPLVILVAVRFTLSLIPSPAGGYLAPGYGNITNIVFFLIFTVVLIKNDWQYPGNTPEKDRSCKH